MHLPSVLWLLSTVFLTCHGATVEIYPDYGPSLVLAAGGQLTLSCRSSEEVTWQHRHFDSVEESPQYDQYVEGPDHITNLTIHNVTYMHVGSYMCQSTTHDKSIYIYVNDKTHLLTNEGISTVFAEPHTDVNIPCKPTRPGINVTLTNPDRKPLTSSTVTYNDQVGFTLQNVTVSDRGDYVCEVATSPDSSPSTKLRLIYTLTLTENDYLPEPDIAPLIDEIMVGETLNLTCTVELGTDAKYRKLHWIWPAKMRNKKASNVDERPLVRNDLDDFTMELISQLIIRNVSNQDRGNYTCKFLGALNQTQTSQFIEVLGSNESHLEVTAKTKLHLLEQESGEATFIALWQASPEPVLAWLSPQGKEIPPGESEAGRYKVEVNKPRMKLTVRKLQLSDAGLYRLKARNEGHEATLNFSLLVESRPQVSLAPMGTYYRAGRAYALHCNVKGYPPPQVTWLFQKCDQYPKCDIDFVEVRTDQYMEYSLPEVVNNEVKSKYNWTAETTGLLMCRACNTNTFQNKYLCENQTIELLVTDLEEGFSISGPEEAFQGDEVHLSCGANKYHYAPNVSISYQRRGGATAVQLETNPKQGITVTKVPSKYSNKVELKLSRALVNQSGDYRCEATRVGLTGQPDRLEVDSYHMNVQVLEAPRFVPGNTMNGNTLQTITGKQVELKCFVRGTPRPGIKWYKDGQEIILSRNDTRTQLLQDNQILNIQYGALKDEGNYKCVAVNRVGKMEASMTVIFSDIKEHRDFFLILALFAVLVILCAIFIYKIRRTSRQFKRKLESLGLKDFEKGQTDLLNPKLYVSQQAEKLPYDTKKWEFPRAKLKLGHELGSGAFGVVMSAEAEGIEQPGVSTTVAVKMVKRNTVDIRYLRALSSELKIMAHLGKHLNIVNLLGACTSNLDKCELLVIVEYCKYGNLHRLLSKHRDVFINQVNSLGDLDPSINTLKPTYVNVSPQMVKHIESATENTGAITFDSIQTAYTVLSDSSGAMSPDGYLVPTAGKVPVTRAGDSTRLESISTQDLICWAYQVASGMKYLASRKVMHGDLAARNILLTDDKIVKICDFGLAKAMFTDNNYQKTGDEPLPIKWMAIESMKDKIFSTQSDVWAYGVTLWEMFSLSTTPYPGIEGVDNVFMKLVSGYRMERPEYCPYPMYQVMLDCWEAQPVHRPDFSELVERVGAMVDNSSREHYLSLNDVYLRLNDEALAQGEDYLAMLSSPDIHNQISAADTEDDGYLKPDDPSMELRPMLPQLAESKASSLSVSNPSYLEFTNNPDHSRDVDACGMPRLSSVDDYEPSPRSKQETTRAAKLDWFFSPHSKTHSTFV